MAIIELIKRMFKLAFIKFIFVAGINTLFGYSIFALAVFILKDKYIATIVSTILGILFNFKTYSVLVFNSKDNSKIFRFFGVYLITLSIQLSMLKLLSVCGVVNPYIAGGILLLPISLLSFLLMRKFVFYWKTVNE